MKKGWETVAEGLSVGHKRIQLLDSVVETSRLRFFVVKAVNKPRIKNLSIYTIEK